MKKKLLVLLAVVVIFVCATLIKDKGTIKSHENLDTTGVKENLNPISKENVINILKAEYGDLIHITEDQISIDKEDYVVDVKIEILESDDSHEHENSLGVHRINMYTGELVKVDNKQK